MHRSCKLEYLDARTQKNRNVLCSPLVRNTLISSHALKFARQLEALVNEATKPCKLPPIKLPQIEATNLPIELERVVFP